MKPHIAILVSLVTASMGFTSIAATYTPLPKELDGTMMPYNQPPESEWLAAPDSLRPFHVEYVGRHGARYLSSAKKLVPLLSVLKKEKELNNLSREGEAFLTLLDDVALKSDGKWGALSALGAQEQNALGTQMATQWASLFSSPRVAVDAISSDVPRVVNSMYNFCHALAAIHPDATVNASSGNVYSPLMRFFETDPLYRSWLAGKLQEPDSWKEPEFEMQRRYIPAAPARRLFRKDPRLSEFEYTLNGETKVRRFDNPDDISAMQALTMEMYGVLQSLRASGIGQPTTRWMTIEEYEACWKSANGSQWLKRSLNPFSTLPERAAVPLLLDIMSKADASIDALRLERIGKKEKVNNYVPSPAANLRFGHAETIMPLAALMNLPGCAELPLDLDKVATEWHNYYVSPLAANIEIVFAEAPSGTIYSAVALNGKPVCFKGEASPWIEWLKLRSLWLQLSASY